MGGEKVTKKETTDMLSAYEQQRLDNMAKNEAFLAALGLSKSEKTTVQKSKKKYETDIPSEPTRTSSRVAHIEPDYGELPHDFCVAEENNRIRPKREKQVVRKSFKDLQAEEAESKEMSKAKRRDMKRLAEKEKRHSLFVSRKEIQHKYVSKREDVKRAECTWGAVGRYPVKGQTAVCPRCNGVFVVPKGGGFRKHTCVPFL